MYKVGVWKVYTGELIRNYVLVNVQAARRYRIYSEEDILYAPRRLTFTDL